MTCQQIEELEVAERYLSGALSEEERDTFEQHFFSCAGCLERLEILQSLPSALRSEAGVRKPQYLVWALAACVLLAAGIVLTTRSGTAVAPPQTAATQAQKPPLDPLIELAKFDPPRYEPASLRGSRSQAAQAFQAGMALYREGAFTEAVPDLEKAAKLDDQDPGALFFLGICRLVKGDAAGGIEALKSVDAMGLTPYQEEARFYLAKGLLRQRDVPGAREALLAVERMNGDLAPKARDTLAQLQNIR
jgi:TolA-binding protein